MAGAISQRARKLAQSVLAFALSAALIAEPAMAQAQDNPAAPTAPATPTRRGQRRRAGGRRELQPRRTREAACANRALSRPFAGADAACERLSRADRPGAALARQEQGARRQERLFRHRQSELGSRGEGAGALSGRHQADERRPRLDDRPRRRRSEPAAGRRRSHPGPSRQGGSGRDAEDDRSADRRTRGGERAARGRRASGVDSAASRGELYLHPADRSVDGLCPDL